MEPVADWEFKLPEDRLSALLADPEIAALLSEAAPDVPLERGAVPMIDEEPGRVPTGAEIPSADFEFGGLAIPAPDEDEEAPFSLLDAEALIGYMADGEIESFVSEFADGGLC